MYYQRRNEQFFDILVGSNQMGCLAKLIHSYHHIIHMVMNMLHLYV